MNYKSIIGGIFMIATKDTIIGDLVNADEGIAPILMSAGLHCLGCAMASGETIEEVNNYLQTLG